MIPGIDFDFNGRMLTIPPLTLGKLQVFQPRIEALNGGVGVESIGTVIDVLHAALARNYPEISKEEIGELVDLGNMLDAFTAAMDVAGVKRKSMATAETGLGEAAALSTGAASTPG